MRGIFKYIAILGTVESGANQTVRRRVSMAKQWWSAHDVGQKARSGHLFWRLVHTTPSTWSQNMHQKKILALEIKFVAAKGGRMPNGEIQRLMGQCTLAKTKHQFVIGVCGYRGTLDPRWENDTQGVRSWSDQAGISLIFRAVG
jgi:hypothetical protein